MKYFLALFIALLSLSATAQIQENIIRMDSANDTFLKGYQAKQLIRVAADSNLYALTHAVLVGQSMQTVFDSGWHKVIGARSGGTTRIDTLYITDSIYDLRVSNDTLWVNDTAYGYSGDVNKWTQSGGKLYPTTSTDVLVAKDSLRVEKFTLLKKNITVNGKIGITGTGRSVFIGIDAGRDDDYSNKYNVAVGFRALRDNIIGLHNVAFGSESLSANTGSENTGSGSSTLLTNTTGNYNTAVGYVALNQSSTLSYNTGVGWRSLSKITVGENNTAIGAGSGYYYTVINPANFLTNSGNSVFIGNYAMAKANGETNQIVIGANTIGKGSNTATLGDDNVTDVWMSEDAGATIHAGNLTLLTLAEDLTADSVLTTEGGITKRTPFSAIIDTTVVLFKYDTIASTASAKIATKYELTSKQNVSDTSVKDATRYWVLQQGYSTTTGTVTSISQGTGMLNSVNPITVTGTIGVDTSKVVLFNDTLPAGKIATKYGLTVKASSDSLFWSANTREVFPKSNKNLYLSSAVRGRPWLKLQNTNADDQGSFMYFDKMSASPFAGDKLGYICVRGKDSGGTDTVDYARIIFESTIVTDTYEAGRIKFEVSYKDVTAQLRNLLDINGADPAGKARVTVNVDKEAVDFVVSSKNITDAFLVDGTTGQMWVSDSTSLWGIDKGSSQIHNIYRDYTSLASGDSIVFFDSKLGWGEMTDGTTYAKFRFTWNGVVTLLTDCTGDVAGTYTASKLCIYDGGTSIIIKNNLATGFYGLIDIHYTNPAP